MLSASVTMLPALSGAVAGCMIPTAQHALRVFSRSSSFLSLTAPTPLRKQQPTQSSDQDTSITTAFTWTFAPLARELTRTAGGFEHRARWPLTNGSTLLDMHVDSSAAARSTSAFSFDLACARRYSSVPHSSQQVHPQQSQEYSSSAAAIELPAQMQETAAPGVLSAWLPKAQPRLKGFSRKLLLRQVNRKIVARLARRFTIGIPVLGESKAVYQSSHGMLHAYCHMLAL